MAGFSVLWRVLGMSDRFLSYYYCTECSRIYRCLMDTKTGQFAATRRGGLHVGHFSYHCTSCETAVFQPSDFKTRVLALLICFIPGLYCLLMPSLVAVVVALITGIAGIRMFRSSLNFSQKCKHIYDRWIMQHGTDPDKWPDANKPN